MHWLAYHILGSDKNMARQVAAIRAGMDPAVAYQTHELDQDRGTEPLVRALDNLFGLISERNRELRELNETLEAKVEARTEALGQANLRLEELALTDVLTGLANRRHALRRLATLWQESTATSTPLVCIMIDADHFKAVNDTYGHDAGDEVLRVVARTLREALRTDDVLSRLGGDEFFIICPKTDHAGGIKVGETIRRDIASLSVPTGEGTWRGSVSVGVAARTPQMQAFEDLIKAADEGVYAAKKAGKNCVRSAQ